MVLELTATQQAALERNEQRVVVGVKIGRGLPMAIHFDGQTIGQAPTNIRESASASNPFLVAAIRDGYGTSRYPNFTKMIEADMEGGPVNDQGRFFFDLPEVPSGIIRVESLSMKDGSDTHASCNNIVFLLNGEDDTEFGDGSIYSYMYGSTQYNTIDAYYDIGAGWVQAFTDAINPAVYGARYWELHQVEFNQSTELLKHRYLRWYDLGETDWEDGTVSAWTGEDINTIGFQMTNGNDGDTMCVAQVWVGTGDDDWPMGEKSEDGSLYFCTGHEPVTLASETYTPRGMDVGAVNISTPQESTAQVAIDDIDGVIAASWYTQRFSGWTVTITEAIRDGGAWVVTRTIPWICTTAERRPDGTFVLNLSGAGGLKPRAGLEVASRADWHLAPEPGTAVRIGGTSTIVR